MDLARIPNSFWNSLSFAVVALTIGLLVFGYRSTTISIEIADTKIGLNQSVNDMERINAELQQKAESLQQAKAELQGRVEQLNAEISRLNSEAAAGGGRPVKPLSVQPAKMPLAEITIPAEALKQNQSQLNAIKQNLIDVRQKQWPKN